MRYLVLLISLLGLVAAPCFGQFSSMSATGPQLEKATAMAEKSLKDLMLIAKQIDAKTLGFENREQIGQATLGVPVADYMVRLDELKEYRAGRPAAELLHATGRLVYPLEVSQKAKSSVVLSFNKGEWLIESFGDASKIQLVTEQRRALARSEGRAEKELFQVRVPALQLFFIGIERSGTVYLSPLLELPGYQLKKGESYPAERVLEQIQESARQHNGEPT